MNLSVNNNQIYHERLVSEQEFNLFEDNNRQMILAKAEGNPANPPANSEPNNFPT